MFDTLIHRLGLGLAPWAVALLTGSAALADLYDPVTLAELREAKPVEAETLYDRFILRHLSADEQEKVGEVVLEFPDALDTPLAMELDRTGKRLVLPLTTLQFLEDMILVRYWFDRAGCSEIAPKAQLSYLAKLLTSEETVPPPLEAFAIDRDVALSSDRNFETLVTLAETSTLIYVMVQELAAILLDQDPEATEDQMNAQEAAADAYAMAHFLRIEDVPWGMVSLLQTYLFAAPMVGDSSLMTTDRLMAQMEILNTNADTYAEAYPSYDRLAHELRTQSSPIAWEAFVRIWDDPVMQKFSMETASIEVPMVNWSTLCPTPTGG